ncbi:MAG: Gfo/Idh/MocA family oxidoreductase [Candidatus Bathyarchaeota archaeon]|nr:Gfo/Idh/MocA family oxidoreductase [Candidatus Bathyarchaeota archaeon]
MNVAVIGVGYWGKKIASEYALMGKTEPNVNLIGVCDVFEDNLAFCKEKYGVPYLAKTPEELFKHSDVDAVHICTPSVTHFNICRDALNSGKHVTVEKPMTLNSLEAIKLVDLAHEKNLVLSVGHIFRFDAAIEKAKSLIENGWFGDLYWMKLTWTALMPLMNGRDIITDLVSHPFDILNFLTNDWPHKVTCVAKAHRKGQNEETAHITSEFKSNMMAHIEVSWLHPDKVREVQIMGSDRFAKIDCMSQKLTAFENDHYFDVPVERSNTMNSELSHFVRCIREGRASCDTFLNKNNGLVGANVVKLLELTRKAMENGRTEQVD